MFEDFELTFIGRGSCFNVKEGNTSAYFKYDKNMYLFDCGENIFERIINNNILEDVTDLNIFITHCHSDHIGSLSSLILYCHFNTNISININHEKSMLNIIKTYLEIQGVPANYYYMNYDKHAHYVSSQHLIIIKEQKTIHSTEFQIPSYSFIITLINEFNRPNEKEYKIFYSGDTSQLYIDIIEDDIYIKYYTDCTIHHYPGNPHLSIEFLDKFVNQNYRYKVYCMHLDSDATIELSKKLGFNVISLNS